MVTRPKRGKALKGGTWPYTEPPRPLRPIVAELRKARYDEGVSQIELAEKMGYSVYALREAESGISTNQLIDTLDCWAQALGYRITLEKVK